MDTHPYSLPVTVGKQHHLQEHIGLHNANEWMVAYTKAVIRSQINIQYMFGTPNNNLCDTKQLKSTKRYQKYKNGRLYTNINTSAGKNALLNNTYNKQ